VEERERSRMAPTAPTAELSEKLQLRGKHVRGWSLMRREEGNNKATVYTVAQLSVAPLVLVFPKMECACAR